MDNNDFYYSSVPKETLDVRNKLITKRWEELSKFYLKYTDETIKHLLYVNAGGAAIVIGFMGASESIRDSICLRLALCFFAFGLGCVGVLRAILLHKVKYLFDNWRKDANRYWKTEIGFTELSENDDKRSEPDWLAFLTGYISGGAFLIGIILGGISLFKGDMMYNFISNIVAVIIGGIITGLVSKYYYSRASKDLNKEASKLIKLDTLMLRSLEEAGLVEYTRDEQGNIKGLIIKVSGSINIKSDAHGNLTIKPKDNKDNKPPNQ